MSFTVGIVGSGLAGRLMAIECVKRGWQLSLFDQDTADGKKSCGFAAAGMIAPYTELASSEMRLFNLGRESIILWPRTLANLSKPVSLQFGGTLVVSHPQDTAELARFRAMLQHKLTANNHNEWQQKIIKIKSRDQLEAYAPGISPTIHDGDWIAEEGHIDSVEFFNASTAFLQQTGTTWHENRKVTTLSPHEICVDNKKYQFDLVCDTRGLGAKSTWHGLRGVRGELIWLHAPQVKLHCPVRLLHPRYPIYISPRANNLYVIGATSIESDDMSAISVESLLELLSAAYTVHPGFAEARFINSLTHARPAFADQQPKISYQKGLLKINGWYRHGYMIGPAVIQDAMHLLAGETSRMKFPGLIEEEAV